MKLNVLFLFSIAVILLAKLPAIAQSPADSSKGKFSGIVFGDYFYTIDNHDATKKDFNGFQFRRIYFTYDYAISPEFDSKLRIEADQAALTNTNKLTFFAKDAYLRWKDAFWNSDITFGLSPNPGFEAIEDAWGYRSLEKTIMDLSGASTTRDIGIDLRGRLIPDGSLRYDVKIGNNSNTSPESNKYKRYYAHVHYKPSPEFQAQVYADYESSAPISDNVLGKDVANGRMTFDGLAHYRDGNVYSVGIEGFIKLTQAGYLSAPGKSLSNLTTFGVSVFGWYGFTPQHRAVVRFDLADPNSSLTNDGNMLVIGAYDFLPNPDVHIMPNVEFVKYQASGAKSDVVARMTVSYSYH